MGIIGGKTIKRKVHEMMQEIENEKKQNASKNENEKESLDAERIK